jgi:hypothetical protein
MSILLVTAGKPSNPGKLAPGGAIRDNVTEELALMVHRVPELMQMMQYNCSRVPLTTDITLCVRGSQSHTIQPDVAFTGISLMKVPNQVGVKLLNALHSTLCAASDSTEEQAILSQ